jgi:hypothetical protein
MHIDMVAYTLNLDRPTSLVKLTTLHGVGQYVCLCVSVAYNWMKRTCRTPHETLICKTKRKCSNSNSNDFNIKLSATSTEIVTIASFLPKEPIKKTVTWNLPLLVLSSAAGNKAPLQKGKTPVQRDSTKTQLRPPRRDGDLVSVPVN